MYFEEQLLALAQVYSICSHCQATPSKINLVLSCPFQRLSLLPGSGCSEVCFGCFLLGSDARACCAKGHCSASLGSACAHQGAVGCPAGPAQHWLLENNSTRSTCSLFGAFSPSLRGRLNEKQVIPFLKEFINKGLDWKTI